ncbi:hypothetical protein FISHEDRAFT_36087 [Fistulina hepatica ATCC 64428]|uniref:MARVEL domain-containing protein n=1 Tax=Fistulina hepatica ATCC 64428 TaxID=1128425 RepID=A0A0D7AMF4_9AGAR|nr:hypothetical protein FISHEDRAFT_36087 [Fistulina hepatica ATCC 64428]
MSIDQHIIRGHRILFGLILVFAIIQMSLSAWLTARFNKHHNQRSNTERDRVRYVLFCSIWTIVFTSLYLVGFWYSATGFILTSVASHFIFVFISWAFWLAAAAAVTHMLSGGLECSCTAFVYCGHLNALEAFSWILWILFTFALVAVITRGVVAIRRGDGPRGSLVSEA